MLAAIDAFQGSDAIPFSKRFSDQFLTDDAEESAKEAFYREGLGFPTCSPPSSADIRAKYAGRRSAL